MISLDVKGAFDRVWWSRLKKKFEARGMTGRALKLVKDYLFNRFLRVVCQGDVSSKKQIFSGVPQGAVWSPSFWNFDIADLPDAVSAEGDDFEYADDCGLWYEVTDENKAVIVAIINNDLDNLIKWGQDNLTTFEPEKTTFTVVSRKRDPFDPFENSAGIRMGGLQVEQVSEVKLVGFLFDSKLTFSSMIDKLARKARTRVASLRRLKPMLDNENLKLTMFVRSILEYAVVALCAWVLLTPIWTNWKESKTLQCRLGDSLSNLCDQGEKQQPSHSLLTCWMGAAMWSYKTMHLKCTNL